MIMVIRTIIVIMIIVIVLISETSKNSLPQDFNLEISMYSIMRSPVASCERPKIRGI